VNPAVVAAVVAAIAAIVGGLLSYRASTRANNVSDRKVDLEEYRDAQARLQQIIVEQDRHNDRLRVQVDRTNAQMDLLQQQVAREVDVSNALRNEVRALQGQIMLLEKLVDSRSMPCWMTGTSGGFGMSTNSPRAIAPEPNATV
jgi:small-conductance mechanosensitive channel